MPATNRTDRRIETFVASLVSEQLGVHPRKVDPSANIVEDLGADSLDVVELIMTLEQVLSCDISDQDVERLLTIENVVDWLRSRLSSDEISLLPVDFEVRKAMALARSRPRRKRRMAEVLLSTRVFTEYLTKLEIAIGVAIVAVESTLRDSPLDHLTTVPLFNESGVLDGAEVFILTPKSVLLFSLREREIDVRSVPLSHIDLSYQFRVSSDAQIESITADTSCAPPFSGVEFHFRFSGQDGIKGALEFHGKFLRNREALF